jgi:hypothetical protein
VTLVVLNRKEEAEYEYAAAKVGFDTAAAATDFKDGDLPSDEKKKKKILVGCFPPDSELPVGVNRRRLHVISNLAWGNGSTQGKINGPGVFTTDFSMNLAVDWTKDFLEQNAGVATIEGEKDAKGKVTEFITFSEAAKKNLKPADTIDNFRERTAQKNYDVNARSNLIDFVLSKLAKQLEAQRQFDYESSIHAQLLERDEAGALLGEFTVTEEFDTVVPLNWPALEGLNTEAKVYPGVWHSKEHLVCQAILQKSAKGGSGARVARFGFGPEEAAPAQTAAAVPAAQSAAPVNESDVVLLDTGAGFRLVVQDIMLGGAPALNSAQAGMSPPIEEMPAADDDAAALSTDSDGSDDSDDSRDELSVSRPRRRGKSVYEDRVTNAKAARVEMASTLPPDVSSTEAGATFLQTKALSALDDDLSTDAGATFLQIRAVAALDDEGSTDDEGDV